MGQRLEDESNTKSLCSLEMPLWAQLLGLKPLTTRKKAPLCPGCFGFRSNIGNSLILSH